MIWMLVVITLNLQVSPVQVKHGEVIETFQNRQDCQARHAAFFEAARDAGQIIPPDFNLGCLVLEMQHV